MVSPPGGRSASEAAPATHSILRHGPDRNKESGLDSCSLLLLLARHLTSSAPWPHIDVSHSSIATRRRLKGRADMGEILGLGMSHFPGMRSAAGGGTNFLRTVQRPDIPDQWKGPKSWAQRLLEQLGDAEGRAHAQQHREGFISECKTLRLALDRFNPDFVLVWGDDQYENFKEDIIPAFCVFAYEDMDAYPYHPERDRLAQSKPISAFGRPAERPHAANAWDEPEDTKLHIRGKRDAAKYLARGLLEAE